MDDCLKGSKTLFAGLFFFWNIQVSCCPRKEGSGVLLHRFAGLALALCPHPFHLLTGPGVSPLWDKALCVLQEGAHGWLVDNEVAFSGAAKLRLLRD